MLSHMSIVIYPELRILRVLCPGDYSLQDMLPEKLSVEQFR
jgi:hypothetical protein